MKIHWRNVVLWISMAVLAYLAWNDISAAWDSDVKFWTEVFG